MAKISQKETATLIFSMDDDSWSHWAQGRGRKTEQAVILEGLNKIRESREAREKIRSWCESFRGHQDEESPGQKSQEAKHRNQIEIRLPAADWGEAFQLVGTPGNPVKPGHLLAAVILESETWKQRGNADAEYASGWFQDQLISSTTSTHTKSLNIGKPITWSAVAVAIATVVAAIATIAIAVANWKMLC